MSASLDEQARLVVLSLKTIEGGQLDVERLKEDTGLARIDVDALASMGVIKRVPTSTLVALGPEASAYVQ